jgi:hypothetical protein
VRTGLFFIEIRLPLSALAILVLLARALHPSL